MSSDGRRRLSSSLHWRMTANAVEPAIALVNRMSITPIATCRHSAGNHAVRECHHVDAKELRSAAHLADAIRVIVVHVPALFARRSLKYFHELRTKLRRSDVANPVPLTEWRGEERFRLGDDTAGSQTRRGFHCRARCGKQGGEI